MFTGLVEACAPLRSLERRGAGARLSVELPEAAWCLAYGESVAVSGVCLTVVELLDRAGQNLPAGSPAAAAAVFDLSAETLARTNLGELRPGDRVNLERALRLADRLGGHLVTGHVDASAWLAGIEDAQDGGRVYSFRVESPWQRYLVEKGSVTLDGVSLTVVEPHASGFRVALIPHTLAVTTLGRAQVGARFNLEVDCIGKWVERFVRPYA